MGLRVLAFLAVWLLVAEAALAGSTQGPVRRDVLGGELASSLDYPYMAHIEFPWHGTCSGALVAMDWVLTAAHCVDGADRDAIRLAEVSLGWDADTQYVRVQEVWRHPRYTDQDNAATSDWDVALIRLEHPADAPAAPVRLGSVALGRVLGPGQDAVIIGDAGTRGSPMHATVTLSECPSEAGDASMLLCHARDERPVVSRGDSGGPLLVGGQDNGALLMGVASTGATIGGTGWSRWTRIGHVREWILAVMLAQGTEGRSAAPSCALPPAGTAAGPVGGRIFENEFFGLCIPLGTTGEGLWTDYRPPMGDPSGYASADREDFLLPGALGSSNYGAYVKDSDGSIWDVTLHPWIGYYAEPCEAWGPGGCETLFRKSQFDIGIPLDMAKNASIRCVPDDGL